MKAMTEEERATFKQKRREYFHAWYRAKLLKDAPPKKAKKVRKKTIVHEPKVEWSFNFVD